MQTEFTRAAAPVMGEAAGDLERLAVLAGHLETLLDAASDDPDGGTPVDLGSSPSAEHRVNGPGVRGSRPDP